MFRFALFGHPVAHSLSPAMHAANFRALGLEADYAAYDVPPERLGDELRRLLAEGVTGFNFTIPHKQKVMPLLDELADSAALAGAVNTVAVDAAGRTTGHNTDVDGFLGGLAEADGATPEGRRILVLGAGGAGTAIARTCARAGCEMLTVANRTPRDGVVALGGADCLRAAREADLVVNATSVGLRPDDPCVLPPEVFHPGQIFYDVIPVRRETATRAAARAAGATTLGGLGFLALQGAAAFRIWTGLEPDAAAMRAALESGEAK